MDLNFDPSHLLALRDRLVEGDRTASEELIRHVQEPLVRTLARKFPRSIRDHVIDAATDALLDFCVRPQMFDPSLNVPVFEFLKLAASRNLQNFEKSEKRLKNREITAVELFFLENVAGADSVGNSGQEERAIDLFAAKVKLMELLPDETDRRILELRLLGEQKHEVFADVLNVGDRPIAEQQRLVKNAKDRIQKFLRRNSEQEGSR
jgi:hypothetical protein